MVAQIIANVLMCHQMYEILGDDYEKKLAAVSVLKQYAEDRDVGRLATALCYILKTPQHRRLLDHIRQVHIMIDVPSYELKKLWYRIIMRLLYRSSMAVMY